MAARRPADRQAHGLRWGTDERRLVDRAFQRGPGHPGGIDPTQMMSAQHMRDLHNREALWARHNQRNFNQNVRRRVRELEAEANLAGQRRRQNDDDEDDDNDGDDDDDAGDDDNGGGANCDGANDGANDRELCLRMSVIQNV